jgi:hypothetical protein
MSESDKWRDLKYQETFDQTLLGLERRRAADPKFTIEDVEGTLKHLYIMDGSDWYGRGELQDCISYATIAAHEHFLAEWKVGK